MTANVLPWTGWPHAPAPVAAVLQNWLRGQRVQLTDDAGRPLPSGPLHLLREAVRLLWLRLLDAGLCLLARAIVPRRAPPAARPAPSGDGPVVLVLPVLPDLSHTFVYREALAMLRQRPQWRVVALERNPTTVVHDAAAALLERAVFAPRGGITARAVRVLRWLLRPEGRALFALYRSQPGGSVADLLGKNPLREPRHPGNAFELADLLAPLRPRALHVYGSTYSANVAMGAAMLLGVPFSITSYVDFEFPYAHKMLAEKAARAQFFRVCTEACSRALGPLLGTPPCPVPVIYFGLDLDRWREQAGLRGQGVLLTAARMVPKKGLQFVPEALAVLASRGGRFTWRVAGDGPELARLRELVARHGLQERVEFLGPVPDAAVRQQIQAADVALLPSVVAADGERDGIPIFLTEAMALGVPVVTTPVGGIPELVRDGETGFLVPPGDSAALAATLEAVLRDPGTARAVGARGRAEVHATHDVGRSAQRLVALIEERAP
jgi:colanic acid/amylovoran biosynthesis glycosyltransferase